MTVNKLILLFALLLVGITGAVWFINSHATIATRLSPQYLAEESALVIVGTVNDMESSIEETDIFTYITISVERIIKGNAGSEVVIKERGGTVGELHAVTIGAATFEKGERVLVFLRDVHGDYRVLGLAQGKFTIVKDEKSGEDVLRRDLSALHFVNDNSPQKREDQNEAMYLEEYVRQILD
jgi:hypothetical protein